MAKTAGPGKGDNLFALDHDGIRAVLAEANAPLLARAEALAAALARVPAVLGNDGIVERVRRFRAQIAEVAKELREARLQDGKPFRVADATVKAFFTETEARLARVDTEVRRRLTEAALLARAEESRASAALAEVGPDRRAATQTSALEQSTAAAIPLRWEVTGFDRTALDLEALRIFLTDAALLGACRKHMEENGPHALDGAFYRQTAIA